MLGKYLTLGYLDPYPKAQNGLKVLDYVVFGLKGLEI